jgi:hypothetical protein
LRFEVIPASVNDLFQQPELRMVKEPLTGKMHANAQVPEDIRPEMHRCRVRVLTWNLRDLWPG